MDYMKIYNLSQENLDKIMFLGPILSIIFLFFGSIIFPSIFYDNFIWKYFWGPIVFDATGSTPWALVEPAEKFTWVSEIVYGIMLLVVLYWIYRLVTKWEIKIDAKFLYGLFPYILMGIIARVFEDSGFFSKPLVYWFVTPLIYFQIVILVVTFIVIGHYLNIYFKNKYFTIPNVLFVSGFLILLPYIYYLIRWFIGDQWGPNNGVNFDIFILIFILVFLITLIVYLVSHFYRENEKIAVFSKPINLAMIAGHMLDGIASYISIYDPLNMGLPLYVEKHPASDILMEIWPPLFPIVKFLLIIVVIYVFDVVYKKELKNYSKIVNILKITIFILGFAPGFRDLLRVMMGV